MTSHARQVSLVQRILGIHDLEMEKVFELG